jgi:hypothetical protein
MDSRAQPETSVVAQCLDWRDGPALFEQLGYFVGYAHGFK